jgi:spore maturation protein CgeB
LPEPLDIVIIGLSITSSWGNGHATTYRGLVRSLSEAGHRVLFLEQDVPWYSASRDLPNPPYGRTELYANLDDLRDRFLDEVRDADVVVVGSYVQDGIAVGDWVQRETRGVAAFYDIDTPVTLAKLREGACEYLEPRQVRDYALYLSFSGGSSLDILRSKYDSPNPKPLYCSFDPDLYFPVEASAEYDLAYMGTYSDDRQPTLEELLIQPASRLPDMKFAVAGPQYPDHIHWPENVRRIEHLPPQEHRAFYNRQRFTLNVTRQNMIRAGHSPSVRLFEAAACGTPIISDYWDGLGELFEIGTEILVASGQNEVIEYLTGIPESRRRQIGAAGRQRVVAEHTSAHRAEQLIGYVREAGREKVCR